MYKRPTRFLFLLVSILGGCWLSFRLAAAQPADADCARAKSGAGQVLAQIRTTNCLVVGVIDAPPLSEQQGNAWRGFEIELAQSLAERWLGDATRIRFENVSSREESTDWLIDGAVDVVIAAMFRADVQGNALNFSVPYLDDALVVIVPDGQAKMAIDKLAGQPVAIVGGPLMMEQAEAFFQAHQVAVNGIEVAAGGTALALESLRNGSFAAMVGSRLQLAEALQAGDLTALALDTPMLTYHVAVKEGEAELLRWLNCSLSALSQTEVWAALYDTLPGAVTPRLIDEPLNCIGVAGFASPPATIASALADIRARDGLVAGVKADVPLFGFKDAGEWSGFELDLMREFARRWLGSADKVEFVQVTSGNRIERLLKGDVDLLAATMTHRKERDAQIDFSQTYYLDGQNILVRADREAWPPADRERIALLDGKTIAAIQGATSLRRIQEFARENGIEIKVVEFEQYDQAVQPLLNGTIDALTTDRGILTGIAQAHPDLLVLLNHNFSSEPYGIGVRPGDSAFVDLINYTLQEMKKDGSYDELYKQWFCQNQAVDQSCTPYPLELLPGAAPYTFATAPISVSLDITGTSVVDRMREDGFFVAGVKYDAPPFGYRDAVGDRSGFEVALMREFARRWLGDPDAVEFVQVTSSNRIPRLIAGEIDIIAATMTHTKGRDALIDFSQTYYQDGQNILVRRDAGLRAGDDPTRVQALDLTTIGAITGSTSIDGIRNFAITQGITVEVAVFEQYDQAIEALLGGKITGLSTDRGILLGFAQQHDELVVLLDQNFSQEPYGLGIRQGDHRFRDLVNFTLQEMKEDGTYDLLYRYWFGITFIMQEQGVTQDERIDIIRRYWSDDPAKPVTETAWLPYQLELWPGMNYFGTPGDVVTTTVRNDLAPMIYVPAGPTFLGTTAALATELNQHPGRNQEQLVVQVDEFFIDQHEVTNQQYRQCVALGRCEAPTRLDILGVDYFYNEKYKNHPVVQVSWAQAQNYCAAFGKTLPTEAQWEKAARYGADESTNYLYPWGDNDTDIEQRATYADSAFKQDFANPVGIYRFDIPVAIHGFAEPIISVSGASPLDVLDMVGNVQEWTADCYEQRFYAQLAAGAPNSLINPTTANSCGAQDERTVRSSGYYDQKYTLSTVFRQGKSPDSVDRLRGFRCVAPAASAPATRLSVVNP